MKIKVLTLGLVVLCFARCLDAKVPTASIVQPPYGGAFVNTWNHNYQCRYNVQFLEPNGEFVNYTFQATQWTKSAGDKKGTTRRAIWQAVDENCLPLQRYMYIQTAGFLKGNQYSIDSDLKGGWEYRLAVIDDFWLCDLKAPKRIMHATLWLRSSYHSVGTITQLPWGPCTEIKAPSGKIPSAEAIGWDRGPQCRYQMYGYEDYIMQATTTMKNGYHVLQAVGTHDCRPLQRFMYVTGGNQWSIFDKLEDGGNSVGVVKSDFSLCHSNTSRVEYHVDGIKRDGHLNKLPWPACTTPL